MGDVDGRVGEGHVGEVDEAGAAAVEAQVRFVEVAVDGPRGHGGVDEQVLGAGEDGVDAVAFDGGEGGGHVFPDALNQCPVLDREPGFADVRRLEGVQPGQGARDRLDDSRTLALVQPLPHLRGHRLARDVAGQGQARAVGDVGGRQQRRRPVEGGDDPRLHVGAAHHARGHRQAGDGADGGVGKQGRARGPLQDDDAMVEALVGHLDAGPGQPGPRIPDGGQRLLG